MLASRDSLPVSSVSYSPSGTRSRLGVMRWRHQALPGHRAGRTTRNSGTLYKWVHVSFNIEIKITCKVRIKDQKRTKSKISVTIFIIYNLWFCDFFSDFFWNCLWLFFWNCLWLFFWNSLNFWLLALVIIVVMSPFSNWMKVLYHREVTWRLRALVRTHRTLNTTSCSHRVAFVCPAGIDYYKNSHLRVAFVCGSSAIVWPSVGIVLASAVHWLLTKFGVIFARNSKFHIHMAIWCQFWDSVTPALQILVRTGEMRLCWHDFTKNHDRSITQKDNVTYFNLLTN
jgi:hypothetical protein